MNLDDVETVAQAIEDALAHDRTPTKVARAAMAADPRVFRLTEALRTVCRQTDGKWAIKLARDALEEIENQK